MRISDWSSDVCSSDLSLLVAFILMGYEGITLNILTLGAMSVAAGRVIDDAIVVIENIHRLLEEGRTRSEAVLEGTSQMVPAITASTDRKSTRLNSSH